MIAYSLPAKLNNKEKKRSKSGEHALKNRGVVVKVTDPCLLHADGLISVCVSEDCCMGSIH